jgi:hypothetical protein
MDNVSDVSEAHIAFVFRVEVSTFIGDHCETSADHGFGALRGPKRGPIAQIFSSTDPVGPKTPIPIFPTPLFI